MKKFLPREFWLMCAPIALFASGTWIVRALNPPPDPNAKIMLDVTRASNTNTGMGQQLNFGWQAEASGGPQRDRRIGFSQSLIASGHGHTRVIFTDPPQANVPPLNSMGKGSSNSSQGERSVISQTLMFSYNNLPVWTQKLEWRGDVVSAPQSPNATVIPTGAATVSTLQQWAKIKGATRVVTQIPVSLDPQKLSPINGLKLEKVNPANVKLGADTCVTTTTRSGEMRTFARLIAFDGKKRRELWRPYNELNEEFDPHDLWKGNPGSGGADQWWDNQLFKLRDVPVQWGEIIYLVDLVANPNLDPAKATIGTTACGAKEIARLKKAGWLHFSRRLVVRENGQIIKAPVYSQTPNTQFLAIKNSLSPTEWTITARLNYSGPDNNYELDSPNGPEFYEANGKHSSLSYESYGIQNGSKPDERLLVIKIARKDMGNPRPLKMKVEIADSQAAPLVINQAIQVPQTTS